MLYILNNSTDPFFNHALEEYIVNNFNDEAFILWQNRPSILIGRNQNTNSEINLDFVKEHNIDIVRRLSGGGTVFCDLGNFNFTFITNKGSKNEDFKTFASPVINALQSLGVNAQFTGRNDITIEGKKISGNAQYHHNKRLLHHGTLLFNGNLSSLSGALVSKPLKFKDKSVKSVASRVTNIYPYLPTKISVKEFKEYLKNYIMKTYDIKDVYRPTKEDLIQINKIKDERFLSWQWNFGKSPKYTYSNHVKYSFGLIEYHLNIKSGIIKDAHIYGDFFGKNPISEIESLLTDTKHDPTSIEKRLKDISIEDYISGIDTITLIKGLTSSTDTPMRKPKWLRIKYEGGKKLNSVNHLIKELKLNTVCLEANCPNKMECYNRKTATFMILGRNCTRNCTFCNVTKADPDPIDLNEPKNVAIGVDRLGLKYAVVTSVTRDDLEDQGAHQFANVVKEIRLLDKNIAVELLVPDMQGNKNLLDIIINSKPDVFNHNIETVPLLYDTVRPMASYQRSLDVLAYVKEKDPSMLTKSGMMLGLGETKNEVIQSLKDLRNVDCDVLTLGQYLQPSKEHISLVDYITPEQFDEYKEIALNLGFKSVASAPLVRSSYHADELIKFI